MAPRAPVLVDIANVGRLLPTFDRSFDGVRIAEYTNSNHHNEGRDVEALCTTAGSTTTLHLSGYRTKNGGYEVNVLFDGSSGIDLYRYGRIVLTSGKQWGMKGYVRDDAIGATSRREWTFCDPGAAFDIAIAGMECFKLNLRRDDPLRATIDLLVKSIEASREEIVRTAARYSKAEDCNAVPDPNENLPRYMD